MAKKVSFVKLIKGIEGLPQIDRINKLTVTAQELAAGGLTGDLNPGVPGVRGEPTFPFPGGMRVDFLEPIPGLKVFMVPRQRILVLDSTTKPVLGRTEAFTVGEGTVTAKIVGVSECPTPYKNKGGQQFYDWTVLIEWEEQSKGLPVLKGESAFGYPVNVESENIILSPGHPNADPPVTGGQGGGVPVPVGANAFTLPPDYKSKYGQKASFVIAVMDTGTRAEMCSFDSTSEPRYLNLNTIRGLGIPGDEDGIGYNGVNNYKRMPRHSPVAFNPPVDPDGKEWKAVSALANKTVRDLTIYAYDDHRLQLNGGTKETGSHGVHVSGMIKKGLKSSLFGILPVKGFDLSGSSALFDVLCCFDYILYQKDRGLNITVVNLSWTGKMNDSGKELLKSKMKELKKRNIWVVAAAGNYGLAEKASGSETSTDAIVDISVPENALYPACFSQEFPNVITVTAVSSNRFVVFREKKNRLTKQTKKQAAQMKRFSKVVAGLSDSKYEIARLAGVSKNYSRDFVDIGVFDEPYHNGLTGSDLFGSSYAAAIVSATLANYLANNPTVVPGDDSSAKDNFINSCANYVPELADFVRNGQMMNEGFTYPVILKDGSGILDWIRANNG